MICPRCNSGTLQESVREGITVDTCPACRGLWLDRGELERLVARAADEWEQAMHPRSRPANPYREDEGRRRRDDGPRYREDQDHYHRGYPPRRKRWFEVLKDVID